MDSLYLVYFDAKGGRPTLFVRVNVKDSRQDTSGQERPWSIRDLWRVTGKSNPWQGGEVIFGWGQGVVYRRNHCL